MTRRHGYCGTATYSSWINMVNRCRCANVSLWKTYYIDRGITVCDRWKDFRNFLADMGERPPNTSLDRIDNSRGYSPENCRWVNRSSQMRNTRANVMLTYAGKTQCLAAWAKDLGFSIHTLHGRLNAYGWSVEDALSTPVLKSRFDPNRKPRRK